MNAVIKILNFLKGPVMGFIIGKQAAHNEQHEDTQEATELHRSTKTNIRGNKKAFNKLLNKFSRNGKKIILIGLLAGTVSACSSGTATMCALEPVCFENENAVRDLARDEFEAVITIFANNVVMFDSCPKKEPCPTGEDDE